MSYTVHKLAELAGISVRTLHYYDEIGLLKPSYAKSNGYRFYDEKELLKLQQLLFYRELEFPLEDIKKILEAPDFNAAEALKDHKKLLELKKKRIEELLETIDKTMKNLKAASSKLSETKGRLRPEQVEGLQRTEGGEDMNNDDLFGGFSQSKWMI